MRLLLHICCGPCSIYPLKVLKDNAFDVTGLFYNPNIHPENEFDLRLNSADLYAKKINLEIIKIKPRQEDFSEYISFNTEKPARCQLCYKMRLEKAAETAKELNFDFFSTTLLVSPYQDHNKLKSIGQTISEKTGVKFFYYDFREGFMNSRIIAKENNLYLQKYCGCDYSRVGAIPRNRPNNMGENTVSPLQKI